MNAKLKELEQALLNSGSNSDSLKVEGNQHGNSLVGTPKRQQAGDRLLTGGCQASVPTVFLCQGPSGRQKMRYLIPPLTIKIKRYGDTKTL